MTLYVHAVLIDLDGTLLDHRGASRTAFQAACAQWVPGLSEEGRRAASEIWQTLETTWMQAYLAGELTFQEQRRMRVSGFLEAFRVGDAGLGPAALDRMFGSYLERYQAAWTGFADVPAALRFFRRAPGGVAVLSNGDRGQQAAKLRALRLSPEPRLFVPADIGAAKPHPGSFSGACAAMGWDPAYVLYVGDSLDGDAVAAARAGLVGCWLDRSAAGTVDVPEPVVRVRGLRELPDLIEWC